MFNDNVLKGFEFENENWEAEGESNRHPPLAFTFVIIHCCQTYTE